MADVDARTLTYGAEAGTATYGGDDTGAAWSTHSRHWGLDGAGLRVDRWALTPETIVLEGEIKHGQRDRLARLEDTANAQRVGGYQGTFRATARDGRAPICVAPPASAPIGPFDGLVTAATFSELSPRRYRLTTTLAFPSERAPPAPSHQSLRTGSDWSLDWPAATLALATDQVTPLQHTPQAGVRALDLQLQLSSGQAQGVVAAGGAVSGAIVRQPPDATPYATDSTAGSELTTTVTPPPTSPLTSKTYILRSWELAREREGDTPVDANITLLEK